MDFALRISRSAEELKDLFEDWEKASGKILAYEHPQDEEVARTHCHILLEACTVGKAALIKRALKMIRLHGNEDWSWVTKDIKSKEEYIRYMTKGKYLPVWNNGYGVDNLSAQALLWVEHPSPRTEPQVKERSKELQDASLFTKYERFISDTLTDELQPGLTVDNFRGPTFAWLRKDGRGLLPCAGTYKRFLVSIYAEYRERTSQGYTQNFEEEIKNVYA